MKRLKNKNAVQGFTLMECLVCVAIIAIVAALALPSFSNSMQNARVSNVIGSMSTSVALARNTAIRLSKATRIMPIASDNWAGGWCVVPESAADCSDPAVLARYDFADAGLSINMTPATALVQFQSDGTRLVTGATPIEFRACSDNDTGRNISIAISGLIRTEAIATACSGS